MPFPVNFYTFSKRENSTKLPEGEGTAISVELKDSCTILSPTLLLRLSSNPSMWNYAYIAQWSRYYFVRNWSWENGLWLAELEEDTLATYKSEIGASNQYILRSSAQFDGAVVDGYYPVKQGVTPSSIVASNNPWQAYYLSGYYVVGIVNGSTDTIGASAFYVMSNAQYVQFKRALFWSPDWMGSNIWDDLSVTAQFTLKAQFNPIQYVTSVQWFPFKPPTSGSVSLLPVGWWSLSNVTADILDSDPIYTHSIELTVPSHPQAGSRGPYLNLSPFSKYQVDAQPWGIIPIDSTKIPSSRKIRLTTYIDCSTGLGVLNIDDGTAYNSLAQSTCQFGVKLDVAQISLDYVAQANNTWGTINNLGRDIFNMVGNKPNLKNISSGIFNISDTLRTGIMDAINLSFPEMQISGAQNSLIPFLQPWSITGWFYPVVDDDNSNLGRPLCSNRVISTIPGYIMVSHPDVELPATQEEMESVESFMSGGFFYE